MKNVSGIPDGMARALAGGTAAAAVLATASLAALPATALAQQAWPVKPVRMLIPWPPGGSNDVAGRIVAPRLADALGQPVTIENRGGAAGTVGADVVARSEPDGYTLMLHSVTHLSNAALYLKLSYDTVKDFTPIGMVSTQPTLLVVHPSFPVKSVKDLIALAKQRPGELTYASGGNGTSHHMGGELFGLLSGTKMSHVPFKGSPQAVGAVVSGEVALMFPNIPNAMGLAKAGKLRILGVTTPKRLSFWPELPTIAESGLPGYEVIAWFGLFAPAGTPSAVIDRMNAEANKALAIPAVRENLMTQGFELMGGTVAEFAAFVRSEIEKWAKVVKATGARAD